MRILITSMVCCLLASSVHGQVVVDKSIHFSGPDAADRQLLGLPPSTAPGAVLAASVDQPGSYRMASPAAGTVWNININGLSSAPIAGTHLVLIAPTVTPGPIQLTVNGNGPYPLLVGPGQSLEGEAVPEGTPLSVIMDGTSFQVLNGSVHERRPCPAGTVAVNGDFCMEIAEHAASDLFTAMATCGIAGFRMCGWGEFILGCQQANALGILDATNNWEWTGDASNENGSARIVGVNSCLNSGNALVTGSIDRAYHCCYSR